MENVVLEKRGRTLENDQRGLGGSRVVSIDALRGFDMFWIIGGGEVFTSLAEVWKHPVTQTIQCQLGPKQASFFSLQSYGLNNFVWTQLPRSRQFAG